MASWLRFLRAQRPEGRRSAEVAVTLYTRRDCELCGEARRVLDAVRRGRSFALTVVDVDADPALAQVYGHDVPVITIDGALAFKYHVTPDALRARLARAERSGDQATA